jgi:CHRD domain
MSKKRIATCVGLLSVVMILVPLSQASAGGAPVTIGPVGMFGGQEVPGPGDPNGEGEATFRLNAGNGRVCFELLWHRIVRPMAAHIHRGRAGVAGPIKVTLFTSRRALPATVNHVHGCVRGVDTALVQRIIDRPDRYYVNVHNRRFPAGAIRGELAGAPS